MNGLNDTWQANGAVPDYSHELLESPSFRLKEPMQQSKDDDYNLFQ